MGSRFQIFVWYGNLFSCANLLKSIWIHLHAMTKKALFNSITLFIKTEAHIESMPSGWRRLFALYLYSNMSFIAKLYWNSVCGPLRSSLPGGWPPWPVVVFSNSFFNIVVGVAYNKTRLWKHFGVSKCTNNFKYQQGDMTKGALAAHCQSCSQ